MCETPLKRHREAEAIRALEAERNRRREVEKERKDKMKLMDRNDTLFLVVDYQERLLPAMYDKEVVEDRVIRLAKGMKKMGIPHIVTQQYPKGIGQTVPEIAEAIGKFEPIDKTTFSCFGCGEFVSALEKADKGTIVIIGIEAHICLQQTVIDLLAKGYRVYIPADCVSSRSAYDKNWSLDRMAHAGAIVTTYEAILYELIRDSKAEEFKAISKIVK